MVGNLFETVLRIVSSICKRLRAIAVDFGTSILDIPGGLCVRASCALWVRSRSRATIGPKGLRVSPRFIDRTVAICSSDRGRRTGA